MERHRGGGGGGGGDRYGNDPDTHHYGRHNRGGPPSSRSSFSPDSYHHHHRRSPINTSNYRGGGGGGSRDNRRPFDSPTRYPPSGSGAGGFRPMGREGGGGGGGSLGGGGFSLNHSMPPLAGQKRAYPFPDRRGSSPAPDRFGGGSFAKLFVGSVPRTATEEDIRPLFEDHGRVLEVAFIRDKRTGQQQGCCFIKYATSVEADRAIRALHNQFNLPGGMGPIQVRYADGERERLGAVEYKLFVGSLNKLATEKEVEEIFAPYGQVEDVYLMRDDMKQSRGCGFVKYSHREMALAAINALNGKYTTRGCDQPLIVRFADPKRPRTSDRATPAYGGPGLEPRLPAPGIRPAPNVGESMHDRIPPNAWQPMSPQNLGQPRNAGTPHSFRSQFPPRSADIASSTPAGRIPGSFSGTTDGVFPGFAVTSAPMLQSSLPQVPYVANQISPLQKPLQSPPHLPTSLQLQTPVTASSAQTPVPRPPLGPVTQVPMSYSSGQNSSNQAFPSQQHSASQAPGFRSASTATGQSSVNSHSQSLNMSTLGNQQLQLLQPHHQSPSQLAQLLSQQTQTLQASFQSSQQAFSQLQQQLQLMQPNQGLMAQHGLQATKQQSPWVGNVPQTATDTSAVKPGGELPAATSLPAVPAITRTSAPSKPSWTEHTSPDGYKYYYNSLTGESKWEKPEELLLYEKQQQQQPPPVQQLQMQSQPQNLSTNHVPQAQVPNQLQTQVQSQIRLPHMLQQTSQPPLYQVPGARGPQNLQELSYTKLPVAAGSMNDQSRLQQGQLPAQDWMWKNRPAGS